MKKTTFLGAILLLLAGDISAVRAADFAAAFLETGVGARGVGMGSAFAAVVDDASATYWNPAGLVRTRGKKLLAALQPLSLDRRQSSASFTFNPRGEMAFGLTWMHASVGDIQGRTGSGVPTGALEDAENAFFVSVGRALGERLALGFTVKILSQRIDVPGWQKAEGSGHGVDLGLQFRLGEKTTLAAVVRNLGASIDWTVQRSAQQASSTEDLLPHVLGVGLAYRPLSGLLLAADLYQGDDSYANLGAEWTINPLLTVRTGLERVPGDDEGIGRVAVGLTLQPMRHEHLRLTYAYTSDQIGAGERSVFGLGIQF